MQVFSEYFNQGMASLQSFFSMCIFDCLQRLQLD